MGRTVMPERGPGLLAVDDVDLAAALGAGLQRGEVGAGTRLAVALAPPDLAAGDARQEALLLLAIAKRHDDRGHHHGPERHHPGRAGQRAFLFEQVALHGVPARAAKFHRPVPAQPALGAQDLRPALQVVAAQVQGVVHLVREVLGQVLGHPLADVGAERQFLGREVQVHRGFLLCLGGG
jgi:hypothetical protein